MCPYRCSGDVDVKGQQCVAWNAAVQTETKPMAVSGGVPIGDAVGAQDIKVAVVDHYNYVVESAQKPILVDVG